MSETQPVILLLQSRSASAEVRTQRAARPARTLQWRLPCRRCGCSLPTSTSRCRLPEPGRNTGEGSADSHGRVQPAAGVPSAAPGRGKLCREVGEWEAANGAARTLQQREERREMQAAPKTVQCCDTEVGMCFQCSAKCIRYLKSLSVNSLGRFNVRSE